MGSVMHGKLLLNRTKLLCICRQDHIVGITSKQSYSSSSQEHTTFYPDNPIRFNASNTYVTCMQCNMQVSASDIKSILPKHTKPA